ncbi:hypothetical protein C4E24_08835 [ANME-1 cluster archaeon AG-394-G21]|nr:hypothetical protein [ANME-1 cluster archaeon AG-394-G21]
MISRTCFERKWITTKHSKTNADPILIEKAIYAFELLGNLVENGINLIFKGGTGLMLLIPKLKRLSILKQLFDLGILFEYITDLKEISQSYKRIADIEASYRDMSLPTDTFLCDTIQASFLISQLDFHGSIKNVYRRELRDGIRRTKEL